MTVAMIVFIVVFVLMTLYFIVEGSLMAAEIKVKLRPNRPEYKFIAVAWFALAVFCMAMAGLFIGLVLTR